MPMPLKKYNIIKNNYCIAYYGLNKEYLVQLKLLRPIIEETYKDISIYICCSGDCQYILKNQKKIINKNDLPIKKADLSYIRVIEDSIDYHPIENLMKESEIQCGPINSESKNIGTKKCALLTNATFPNRCLTGKQILYIESFFKEKNFQVHINPKLEEIVKQFEVVVGVENEILYQSASEGIETHLVPTGIGENLFKSMFPYNFIFRLTN